MDDELINTLIKMGFEENKSSGLSLIDFSYKLDNYKVFKRFHTYFLDKMYDKDYTFTASNPDEMVTFVKEYFKQIIRQKRIKYLLNDIK